MKSIVHDTYFRPHPPVLFVPTGESYLGRPPKIFWNVEERGRRKKAIVYGYVWTETDNGLPDIRKRIPPIDLTITTPFVPGVVHEPIEIDLTKQEYIRFRKAIIRQIHKDPNSAFAKVAKYYLNSSHLRYISHEGYPVTKRRA